MNWLSKMFGEENPQQQQAWDEDALIVDVRTPAEFASGHVQGATNIPLDQLANLFEKAFPNRTQQVVLYCRSGARSGAAQQFLMQQKFTNVVNGGSVQLVAMQLNQPIV